MGYYTYFTLETKNEINFKEFIKFCMNEKKHNDCFLYPFDLELYANFENLELINNENVCIELIADQEAKWYNYTDDMKKLSEYFPNVIFSLQGDGEEKLDMWIHYFCNGKSYRETIIQIVKKDFDENKLKF